MKQLKYIIPVLCVLAMMAGTGCSYVSDAIEGAIMERSSFSIEAEYDSVNERVYINWVYSDTSQNFAGYEIYMTDQVDNEYAGYDLRASRYDRANTSSNISNLASGTVTEFTDYVDDVVHSVEEHLGPGVYFFRVGIIHWDEDPEDRTLDNGYTDFTETDYEKHTDIDKISGYAEVYID